MTYLPWTSWARACKKGEIPPEWQEILDHNNNVGMYGKRRERHPDPPPDSCRWCGGAVQGQNRFREDGVQLLYKYCSSRCSLDAYIERRRRRRILARHKVCEVCDQRFTATRSDQKTCSAACKQKAYRQRKRRQVAG